VPKDQKPAVGQRANQVKTALEAAFKEKQQSLGASAAAAPTGPMIDVTEPGIISSQNLGRRHIISRVREELVEVFARMGFSAAQAPELEDDHHNFAKLNTPSDHPARDPLDNFYIVEPTATARPRMLRSQTSTVQIRVMEAAVAEGGGTLKRPIKIVAPGRV